MMAQMNVERVQVNNMYDLVIRIQKAETPADGEEILKEYIEKITNEKMNKLWAITYDFLYNRHKGLCDEWEEKIKGVED